MNSKWIFALLSLAMLFWGLNVVAIKVLVSYYPPVMITAIRVTIAGLCVMLFTWTTEGFRQISAREWLYMLLAGLTGIFGHHLFLATGLKSTTSSNGSLILALNPLTTALLAFIFLKERLSLLRGVGIVSGFFGVSLLVFNSGGPSMPGVHSGDVLVFLAMLSQAVSFLAVRKVVATVPVNQVTSYTFLIGGVLLFLFGYYLEQISPVRVLSAVSPSMWLLLMASALLATSFGGIIWNKGIRELGPGQTAIFINMTPFYGLVGAALFLGEEIGFSHVFGFIFIVAGVFLGSGWFELKMNKKKGPAPSEESKAL